MWMDLTQSVEGLKSKTLRFPRKEETSPQDRITNSCLTLQPASLPYGFQTCQPQ